MEVQLTPDQEAFIRQAVASGRYPSPEAAVRDAMARWEERERVRVELLATLDASQRGSAEVGAVCPPLRLLFGKWRSRALTFVARR
jgi:putative addiction module CopG family antidote